MKPIKITKISTILLTGPCTNDPYLLECRKRRSAAFIEIQTDSDYRGLGETYAGYFCPEAVPALVDFFNPILVGQHAPSDANAATWIHELWQRMYFCGNFWCRVGLGAIVLTGIEAALWDLAGKILSKPVYELLGGAKHRSLPCYATGGPSNYPKDRLAAKADHYLSLGFKGFKISAGKLEGGEYTLSGESAQEIAEFEADKIEFLRRHVGPDVNILMDGHMGNSTAGTWDLNTAIAVAKGLEPFNLFLLEEALPYRDPQRYADLAAATTVPIAGGECLSTLPEWREYIRRDSFDIAQPDASYVGGLAEFCRIAGELSGRGKKIATHAWGAGGSLMQNIHAGFSCKNTCMLEFAPDYAELHKLIMGDSIQIKDGNILLPQTPGLGIELTDEVRNRYPFVPGSGEFNTVPGKVLVD
ncbi:MAG: mandelate racemase/muconate lactonizing enzyme family protein [Tardiphaga sp.]